MPKTATVVPPNGVFPLQNQEGRSVQFPDFQTWKQTPEDNHLMRNYLTKGYAAPREVAVEYQMGRQFITPLAMADSSGQVAKTAKLDSLNELLADAQNKRRDFNKLTPRESFRPPNMINLTEHKRDIWLRKLADDKTPLSQLSKGIPHGLKNKVLLEQCLFHGVSVRRTVWLIKCVGSNEQRLLSRNKLNAGPLAIEKWVIEWTEQMTTFLESIMNDIFKNASGDTDWKNKLNFALDLSVCLFIDGLINKIKFLSWIVSYLSKLVKGGNADSEKFSINKLKPISVHYAFLHKFWFKIIKVDYLSKELSETMLTLLIKLNEIPKSEKYDFLILDYANKYHDLIRYLFYYNSDAFIIPFTWTKLKAQLKKVLDMQIPIVSDQYNLIHYRNQSLMIDDSNYKKYSSDHTLTILNKLNSLENDSIEDIVKMIFDLDSSKKKIGSSSNWKSNLMNTLKWSIENNVYPENNYDYSSFRVSLMVSVLEMRLSQLNELKSKKSIPLKSELEIVITSFVNNMSEILNFNEESSMRPDQFSINGFLQLITQLNDHKIFITSSYLRKLIASGVIYLSKPDKTCYIHLLILNSIKELRLGNSKNILKRLSESTQIQIPDQDILIDQLQVQTMDFWTKLSDPAFISDVEILAEWQVYKSSWLWKFQPLESQLRQQQEEILNQSVRSSLGKFIIDLIRNTKNQRSNVFQLTKVKINILLEIALEFDVVGDLLVFIIRGLDLDLANVEESPEIGMKFRLTNERLVCDVLKLSNYYQKLLKSQLIAGEFGTKWDFIKNCLKNWTVNGNRLNIIQWDHLATGGKLTNIEIDKLTLDEITGLCLTGQDLDALGISSIDTLIDGSNDEYNLVIDRSIHMYINYIKGISVDTINFSSLINFIKCLKYWKSNEFQLKLVNYIRNDLTSGLVLDYELNKRIVTRIIGDSILPMESFIRIFSGDSSNSLIIDVLFGDNNPFDLKYQSWKYSNEHQEEYFKFLFDAISAKFIYQYADKEQSTIVGNVMDGVSVSNPLVDSPALTNNTVVVNTDVIDSFPELSSVAMPHQQDKVLDEVPTPLVSQVAQNQENVSQQLSRDNSAQLPVKNGNLQPINFSKCLSGGFWALVNQHMELFQKFYYQSGQTYDRFALREYFLKVQGLQRGDFQVLVTKVIEGLSYFNLPLYQWIFRGIIIEMVDDNESYQFGDFIVQLLQIIKSSKIKGQYMMIIGELFTYIPKKIKVEILLSCEDVYLTNDLFPSYLMQGENMTEYLNQIILSCSKFSNTSQIDNDFNGDDNIDLTNEIVFALNMSIEKLSSFCNSIDHPARRSHPLAYSFNGGHSNSSNNRMEKLDALNKGLRMISKIIMLHQKYLVNLIIKRSVNLQKDVLLLNLTRLYNNKLISRNPKLKNLLYDVLMSMKIMITESIIHEQQMRAINQHQQQQNVQQQNPQPNQPPLPVQSLPPPTPMWFNKVTTPTAYMSSPKFITSSSAGNTNVANASNTNVGQSSVPPGVPATMYVNIPNILNIKPPSSNSSLKHLLKYFKGFSDTIDDREKRYYIANQKLDRSWDGQAPLTKFVIKPFDMIEEATQEGMDTPISLSLLECSYDRKNPA